MIYCTLISIKDFFLFFQLCSSALFSKIFMAVYFVSIEKGKGAQIEIRLCDSNSKNE